MFPANPQKANLGTNPRNSPGGKVSDALDLKMAYCLRCSTHCARTWLPDLGRLRVI